MESSAQSGNDEELLNGHMEIGLKDGDDAIPVSNEVVYVKLSEDQVIDLEGSAGVSVSIENIQSIDLPGTVDPVCCIHAEGQELGAVPYFTVSSSDMYDLQEIKVVSEEVENDKKDIGFEVSNECLQILPNEYDHEEEFCLDQSDIVNLNDGIASEVLIKSQSSDDSSTHSDSSIVKALLSKKVESKSCSGKTNDETSVRRSSRIRSIAEKTQKDTKKAKTKSITSTAGRKKETEASSTERNDATGKTGKSRSKNSRLKTKRKQSSCSEIEDDDTSEEKPERNDSDKVQNNSQSDDVKPGNFILEEITLPSNEITEKESLPQASNLAETVVETSLPNFPSTDVSQVKPLNVLSSAVESVNLNDKCHGEESLSVKPEKVKSRWRRNSELELSGPTQIESEERPGTPDGKDTFPPITEELTVAVKTADETKESPPSYESLDSNIYRFERKRCKTKKEVRRMLCDCTLTKEEIERCIVGCDDDCLNRLLMIECGSRCAMGDFCSNKRFQKRQYMKLEPFKTEKKGWGLRVLESASAGSFVIEYVGEVLSRPEFKQRVKQYAREKCPHYYFMALKSDEIIDATNRGNVSRFINHSCSPNCETQKWTVNGELRIGFFAKRDIPAGEELTFDYKFQRYGREAQSCHCESENCTGFIGEAKPLDVSVSNKTTTKRKKTPEEKKRQAFEDMMFVEELEKLCSNGGLRNRSETLILARLMVRAEDVNSRLCLLDVILKTTEAACLRLFLDYHGLSLMWSWMADVTDFLLKSKILEVLSLLPVSNKTMLLDSKVLNVVQKWANDPNQGIKRSIEMTDMGNSLTATTSDESCLKKQKLSDISDSDETNGTPVLSSEEGTESNDTTQPGDTVKPVDSDTAVMPQTADSEKSVDKAEDDSSERKNIGSELTERADKLLESWSNLAEVFRIPRLEQQKRRADELEADGQTESHSPASALAGDALQKDKESAELSNQEAKGDSLSSEKGMKIENIGDRKFYASKIPAIVTDESKRPRKTLLPTPPRLSKEERRHLFAMEVQQKDQEALRKQHEESTETYSTEEYPQPYENGYYYGENEYTTAGQAAFVDNTAVPYGSEMSSLEEHQSAIRQTLLPTPMFPDNVNLTVPPPQYTEPPPQITFPPPGMVFSAPPPQLQFPPPSLSQPPPTIINNAGPSTLHSLPVLSSIPVMPQPTIHSIPPNVPPPGLPPLGLQKPMPIPVLTPVTQSQPAVAATTANLMPHAYSAPPTGVPVQYMPVAPTFSTPAQQPYYSYPQSSNAPVAVPTEYPAAVATEHVALGAPIAVPTTIQLPPNWKTATDSEGTVYYYNRITRETQWDPPEYEEEFIDEDSDTPVYDEPNNALMHTRRRGTTTAAADTSFAVEVAKKIKELFRTKMSTFVISCLNVYRKPECTAGKIQSTEDFKYLARKLTHFVMAKELKHCKNVEELDCNDNVKRKAKDYIMKYMSRMGPYYDKDKND